MKRLALPLVALAALAAPLTAAALSCGFFGEEVDADRLIVESDGVRLERDSAEAVRLEGLLRITSFDGELRVTLDGRSLGTLPEVRL